MGGTRRVVAARRPGALVAALAAVLTAGCAHTAKKSAALEELTAAWPAAPSEAWISGHRLSVIVQRPAGPARFRAWWRGGGLDEHGYRFRVAELEPVDLEPEEDERPGRAREVVVLGVDAWERFARAFAERLAPREPGVATVLAVGGNDVVAYRDAGGAVRTIPRRDAPSGLVTGERLNLIELASEAVRFIADEVATRGAAASAFLFVLPRQARGGNRMLLYDTREKLCVAVLLPPTHVPKRAGSPLTRKARQVTALTVEAHGLALVKNPISSLGRALSIFLQWVATWATRKGPSIEPAPPLSGAPPMDLAAWDRELTRLVGRRPDRGSLRLLIGGERYWPVLERRIRETHESVAMRVNIFDTDDVAVGIADLLRERSHEVRVRVLMDELSTLVAGDAPPLTALPPDFVVPFSMWRYLERGSKVAARAFLNPWLSSDHSKVFIFDRRWAHLGGMNIGREYRYEWHDLMVELEGPIVGRLARDFERAWAHAGALGDLAYAGVAAGSSKRFVGEATRPDYVDLHRLYTNTADPQVYIALMRAAKRARSYILVENPYLYENSFVKALVAARRRGVDVRVVLPSDSDLGLGDKSNMVTANALIANGVRVYVYPGMTHVKAALIDGWVCLGSANFNKLSLRRNFETNIATSDARFAAELRRDLFERDFAVSTELTAPVAISSGDRFAEWVMDQF